MERWSKMIACADESTPSMVTLSGEPGRGTSGSKAAGPRLQDQAQHTEPMYGYITYSAVRHRKSTAMASVAFRRGHRSALRLRVLSVWQLQNKRRSRRALRRIPFVREIVMTYPCRLFFSNEARLVRRCTGRKSTSRRLLLATWPVRGHRDGIRRRVLCSAFPANDRD